MNICLWVTHSLLGDTNRPAQLSPLLLLPLDGQVVIEAPTPGVPV